MRRRSDHPAQAPTVAAAAINTKDVLPKQGSKVSKSSIATLLSVTLTLVILSLLQSKRSHMRRRDRDLSRSSTRRRTTKSKHQQDRCKSATSHPVLLPASSHSDTFLHMGRMAADAQLLSQSTARSSSHAVAAIRAEHAEPTQMKHSVPSHIDRDRQASPTRSLATSNFDLGPHSSDSRNQYSVNNVAWSLSDSDLPGKRAKVDFVTAWLQQQDTLAGNLEAFDVQVHGAWSESNDRIDQMEEQHRRERHSEFGFQSNPDSQRNQQTAINSGAQWEPRHEHHPSPYYGGAHRGSAYAAHHPPAERLSLVSWEEHRPSCLARSSQHSPMHPTHHYPSEQSHLYTTAWQDRDHDQLSDSLQSYDGIHHPSRTSVGQGHRRSLSLTHADPSPHWHEHQSQSTLSMSPAEQVRHEHHLRRQRAQMLHQQQRQHRYQQQLQYEIYRQDYQYRHGAPHRPNSYYHYEPQQHHNQYGHHHTHPATASLGRAHLRYDSMHRASKVRSVNDLAWERHYFYQLQQHQEEALAEQRRIEALRSKQEQVLQQQPRHRDSLHVPELDPVLRTSSLSRITSSSLSPRTAQALGLSRSKSASVASVRPQGSASTLSLSESGLKRSVVSDCKFLSAGRRLIKRQDAKAATSESARTSDTSSQREGATPLPTLMVHSQESTSSLSRRKTLKDFAPSIRSLARRCSSRFSSRPNSFAGSSSDPIVQFPEGKKAIENPIMRSGHSSPDSSDSAPRLRTVRPSTVVGLQQLTPATSTGHSSKYSSLDPSTFSSSTAPERIPIHRKVTLFRSKTVTLPRAHNVTTHTASAAQMPTTTTAAISSGSTIPVRTKSLNTGASGSLRLANGRGLDLDIVKSRTIANQDSVSASVHRLDDRLIVRGDSSSLSSITGDEDPQKLARHQVLTLLAMGRKNRVSAKTGQVLPHEPLPLPDSLLSSWTTTTTRDHQLSPLALETQDDDELPLQTNTAEAQPSGSEDPCERIAFMLVPKSRYEFQPLVAL
ncbi:hypothetical protein EC968_001226 [Mortierella alpina]|nr:hypothetical protein EC968_001226 [Mortierella alpina]